MLSHLILESRNFIFKKKKKKRKKEKKKWKVKNRRLEKRREKNVSAAAARGKLRLPVQNHLLDSYLKSYTRKKDMTRSRHIPGYTTSITENNSKTSAAISKEDCCRDTGAGENRFSPCVCVWTLKRLSPSPVFFVNVKNHVFKIRLSCLFSFI